MTNNLYFAVNAVAKHTYDVFADSRFKFDVFASDVSAADVDVFDIYEHISLTDSRFCIWQRF